MSAAAQAPAPDPGDGTTGPWVHGDGAGHRLTLHLARAGTAPRPDDVAGKVDPPPREGDPRVREGDPRVRLAPRTEGPAERLTATAGTPGPPPALGSPEARARRPQLGTALPGAVPGPDASSATEVALPDPTQLCCAMVQAAVEGLRGARPLAQLVRWVSPEVYEELALRAELVLRSGLPTVAGRAGIRRVRVCRIGSRTAEATVVVDDGPRVRAVAVRLEAHRGRWRATAMQIG